MLLEAFPQSYDSNIFPHRARDFPAGSIAKKETFIAKKENFIAK
jgi:hypothetical protein